MLQKRSGRVSAPACSTVTAMESVAVGAGQAFVLHRAVMPGHSLIGI